VDQLKIARSTSFSLTISSFIYQPFRVLLTKSALARAKHKNVRRGPGAHQRTADPQLLVGCCRGQKLGLSASARSISPIMAPMSSPKYAAARFGVTGRARFRGEAEFVFFDGTCVPFPDESFDIASAACVFHHINQREHVTLLRELLRVLVSGGIVLVYEHNPYNPVTRHAVNTCPFDENAHLIPARSMRQRFIAAGFANPRIRYRVFFPSVVRSLRRLEPWITRLPLGAQYYVAASK
jgi:SAM-dependent methyltransferase